MSSTEPTDQASSPPGGREPTEEEIDSVRTLLPPLLAAAEADPDLFLTVDEVLTRLLVDDVSAATINRVGFALNQVAGPEAGFFLLFYLTHDTPVVLAGAMAEILRGSESAGASLDRALRRLQAVHGFDLADAHRLNGRDPLTWSNAYREVLWDAISEEWRCELRLRRYDGEELELKMSVADTIRLATSIVATLGWVDPAALDQEAMGELLGPIESLLERYGFDLVRIDERS